MRTAKSWAEEWSGTTVSSPEDVEKFIRRIQADAQSDAPDPEPIPCGKHRHPREWVQRCDRCEAEFIDFIIEKKKP